MDHHFLFSLLLATLAFRPLSLLAQPTANPGSQVTVEGSVYCDPCLNNGFSRHSYFMQDADVHIQCRVNTRSAATTEIITFSVNRTTDTHGVFKLDIPYVDGVNCVEGPPMKFFCQASLIRSSTPTCNIPAIRTTTYQMSVKSKQENLCIYSFPGMSFMPPERNDTLCGKTTEAPSGSMDPTRVIKNRFFWPKFPVPKQTSLPFPFFNPPPNPTLSSPPGPPPPAPAFDSGDPGSWFPQYPFLYPPPPPPPSPTFNPWDPRTWPPIGPSPPAGPTNKNQ